VYVIDRDGSVLYAFAKEDYTERPEPEDVVRFLNAALGG
jgi:peroxiredoxin